MAITGDGELAPTKQEVISEIVQRELISESVLAPTVMDVSRFAKKGSNQVSFPKRSSFTVENRASGVASVQQAIPFEKDTMDLDFRATVSWLIDSMDELESVVDVDEEYSRMAARAQAVFLDNQIINELEVIGVPEGAGALSDTVILSMRAGLLTRKANRRRLRLAIGPDDESLLLAISKFVSADEYGNSRIPSGALGTLYGVPVFITPELAGGTFYMYEEEGISMGFQRGPQLDERKAPEFGAGSTLKVLDQKFGIKGLHIEEQGVTSVQSALVAKDGN